MNEFKIKRPDGIEVVFTGDAVAIQTLKELVGDLKRYRFHWRDGSKNEGYGRSVADAFTRLGYGAGAVAALDFYEEIAVGVEDAP